MLTIPFSEEEYLKKYNLCTFTERNLMFRILSESDCAPTMVGNFYRFGIIDKEGKKHWFFYGKNITDVRTDAIGIVNAIQEEHKDGTVFAMRSKK